VVDFTNTIIICTSNVGSDLIQRHLETRSRDEKGLKDQLMALLRRHLRPEFLNRIDEVIVFRALDRAQIRQIVGLQLERVKRMTHGQGITLEFDESLVDHLADVGYQPEYGARELRRQVRSLVETRLAQAMLRGEIADGDTVRFRYDRASGDVRWDKQEAMRERPEPEAPSVEPRAPMH
jgi:ATP-dependent Clp protease ATP-binding subunit ClpC